MIDKQKALIQQGVWIDSRQLAEAGLGGELEITVDHGEIRIRSSEPVDQSPEAAGDDMLLGLAGMLSIASLSSSEIDEDLYGGEQ
jgi:hypothetical protein